MLGVGKNVVQPDKICLADLTGVTSKSSNDLPFNHYYLRINRRTKKGKDIKTMGVEGVKILIITTTPECGTDQQQTQNLLNF